jgi:hypothetical protein
MRGICEAFASGCVLQADPTAKIRKEDEMADISDYFRVVSIEDNVNHIELKGFWSDQVVDQFGAEMQAKVTRAMASVRGRRFILLADWSGSPVFGPKAEEHLAQALTIFKQYNGYKVVEVVPKSLVKMGLRKVATETGKDDIRITVSTLAEARQVIEGLKKELQRMES